ncbi:MAG: hypothetical protein [Circoviridae sp.]|nr:MAG: hypothetical protein [Circoviridae sp.]
MPSVAAAPQGRRSVFSILYTAAGKDRRDAQSRRPCLLFTCSLIVFKGGVAVINSRSITPPNFNNSPRLPIYFRFLLDFFIFHFLIFRCTASSVHAHPSAQGFRTPCPSHSSPCESRRVSPPSSLVECPGLVQNSSFWTRILLPTLSLQTLGTLCLL